MPITIIRRVDETYEGKAQWEVEQGGQRMYMTAREIMQAAQ